MKNSTFTAPQFSGIELDFEQLAWFDLDDDARDQIGTFAVAVFVALLATLARVAVQRKDRWWLNMLVVHGAILVYWSQQCHLNTPANPWLKTIHGGLCWRDSEGAFQQIALWGGDRERFWLNVLVWLAICANVVPAYATGNEASRHMTHVKKRACNPLINHIIAGILCVIFPYFVVTWKLSVGIPIAVILDIYHQITIHRLISNHDGIWVLRAVSMSLAISKWIVILNMYTTDPVAMLDQMFVMSTGFLGTRAYAATAYILYMLGLGDIKTAQWYSIGLMLADIGIMGRCWGQMRIAFWLTVVNCAAIHYHQMWKKWINLRPAFVLSCCVMTMIVVHSGNIASLLFTIMWSFGNFMLPHFNRFRPAPPKAQAYTPTVTTRVYELAKSLSTRITKSLSTRAEGFLKSKTLENSREIQTRSMRTLESLATPKLATTPRLSLLATQKPHLLTETPCSSAPSHFNLLTEQRTSSSVLTPLAETIEPVEGCSDSEVTKFTFDEDDELPKLNKSRSSTPWEKTAEGEEGFSFETEDVGLAAASFRLLDESDLALACETELPTELAQLEAELTKLRAKISKRLKEKGNSSWLGRVRARVSRLRSRSPSPSPSIDEHPKAVVSPRSR